MTRRTPILAGFRRRITSAAVTAAVIAAVGGGCAPLHAAEADSPRDNIGHRRHFHRHGAPHATVTDPERFVTNRQGAELPLPAPSDAFTFAVFGDRTGGPAEGVAILADAVRDVNLFEPDLVMTVGDLVQGYNQTPEYLEEVAEFKGIMGQLLMPWFPVAGNHDIYWVGADRPAGHHEANYEEQFGPLWYAFEHQNCWFVVLYSDEGDPETGKKGFQDPAAQRISEEQLAWLRQTLQRTRAAEHVFVFLHHPRWLGGGYGEDWDRVHEVLVDAGNVSVVFAGHIHRMRHDGPRDGIEYVTLATVGGGQAGIVPKTGWLHHYLLVTVRAGQVALASVPVGEVADVRDISGELADEAAAIAQAPLVVAEALRLRRNGSAAGTVRTSLVNTSSRPLAVTVLPDSRDSRWSFAPDHRHATLQAGESLPVAFDVRRAGDSLDDAIRPLELVVQGELLTAGFRYALPERRVAVPASLPRVPRRRGERVARFTGEDALQVADASLALPAGPFTVECWFAADDTEGTAGLVAKTEGSGYGLFLQGARPAFYVHLDGSYVIARADEDVVQPRRWHHLAGTHDGEQVRLFLDGRLVASQPGGGERATNRLPLHVGAEVDSRGDPRLHFRGLIDGVRLSRVARHVEDFTPRRRVDADADTVLLLDMERSLGSWVLDESRSRADALVAGAPTLQPLDEANRN